MASPQVVIITGSSSGFGAAAARELAVRGHHVIATMRDPDHSGAAVAQSMSDNLEIHRLDVRDRASIDAVVAMALGRHGRIDALVNNAGYLLLGAIEDLDEDELVSQLDTNMIGSVRTAQAVLPAMRQRRTGKIINVSSVAGRMTGPAFGAYCASKWALEAMSEALRFEVAPWGIDVVIVEPGTQHTGAQFDNMVLARRLREGASPYAGPCNALVQGHQGYAGQRPGPRTVGSMIADLVETVDPLPLRLPIGDEAALILGMRARMSDEEFEEAMRTMDNDGFPGAYFKAVRSEAPPS